jgi:hypothetical protein
LVGAASALANEAEAPLRIFCGVWAWASRPPTVKTITMSRGECRVVRCKIVLAAELARDDMDGSRFEGSLGRRRSLPAREPV